MNIQQKIKELREEKSKSQYEISKEIDVARYTYANWEQGRSEPSIADLEKLANYFGCTIDYLIGRENDFGITQNKTNSLTTKEERLLKSFTQLDTDEQDKIIEDCEYFANKHIKSRRA